MIVLVIVGKIGCGKDTVSEYLCKDYGFSYASYSEVAHQKVRDEGLETTRANLQRIATEWRAKHGEDIFAKLVVEWAQSLGNDRIVLKEARTKQDLGPPMKTFGKDLHVIEVIVDKKTRFERLKKRGGAKDAKTMEEFLAQEKREGELGYFGAAEMAEIRISNDGTPKDLYKKIDDLMKKFRIEKP